MRIYFVIFAVLLALGGLWAYSNGSIWPFSTEPETVSRSEDDPVQDHRSSSADSRDLQEIDYESRTDAQWKKILTPMQYKVTQRKGTEPPGDNEYWDSKRDGMYRCVCCDAALFDIKTKFVSGTGWPSFYQPVAREAIDEVEDNGFFSRRVEVVCRRCKAHLGHVFDDAPQTPTGLRYCLNSASLRLKDREEKTEEPKKP